jgi:hypothetical protein
MTYSFLADMGDGGDELLLRDHYHASNHADFAMPSSRATIQDSQYGWVLCRINCPVKIIAEVKDLYQTSTRWNYDMRMRRPGCPNKIAPCVNAVMLDLANTALHSIDVFAADLQPINALMLLLAVELSDLDLFRVNATAGASPIFANLRTKSFSAVSFTHLISFRPHFPSAFVPNHLESVHLFLHQPFFLSLLFNSIDNLSTNQGPASQVATKIMRNQQQESMRQR